MTMQHVTYITVWANTVLYTLALCARCLGEAWWTAWEGEGYHWWQLLWSAGTGLPRGNNNNNNKTQDDIYSAVIMTTRSLREFTRFIWWMYNSVKWLPTLRLRHVTWAVSPPVGSYRLQPPSPFIIITQPESWYSFTVPRVEGWVDLGTAGKVHTARDQGCKSQWFLRQTQLPTVWFDPSTSHIAVSHSTDRAPRPV